MTRSVVRRRVHLGAGLISFVLILSFWSSTIVVELLGSTEAVATVKSAIRWSLLALVPALAVTGATGFAMAGRSTNRLILAKKRRMPVIGCVGLLVLVPAALFLAAAASDRQLGTAFYAVQAVELVAGATNLSLMTLNIRDGLRLSARRGHDARPLRARRGVQQGHERVPAAAKDLGQ